MRFTENSATSNKKGNVHLSQPWSHLYPYPLVEKSFVFSMASDTKTVMISQWGNKRISLSVLSVARVMIAQRENECISLSVLFVARRPQPRWTDDVAIHSANPSSATVDRRCGYSLRQPVLRHRGQTMWLLWIKLRRFLTTCITPVGPVLLLASAGGVSVKPCQWSWAVSHTVTRAKFPVIAEHFMRFFPG